LVNKDLFEEVQKLLDMNMSHNKAWGVQGLCLRENDDMWFL